MKEVINGLKSIITKNTKSKVELTDNGMKLIVSVLKTHGYNEKSRKVLKEIINCTDKEFKNIVTEGWDHIGEIINNNINFSAINTHKVINNLTSSTEFIGSKIECKLYATKKNTGRRLPIYSVVDISINYAYDSTKLIKNIYEEYEDEIGKYRPLSEIKKILDNLPNISETSKKVITLYEHGKSEREIADILQLDYYIVKDLVDEYELIPEIKRGSNKNFSLPRKKLNSIQFKDLGLDKSTKDRLEEIIVEANRKDTDHGYAYAYEEIFNLLVESWTV